MSVNLNTSASGMGASPSGGRMTWKAFASRMTGAREMMLLGVVALMFVVMCFASPYFLSGANLLAVLLSLSMEAIMVVGMVSLMVSGGFDMSVGSIVALSGGIAALLMKAGLPVWLGVVAANFGFLGAVARKRGAAFAGKALGLVFLRNFSIIWGVGVGFWEYFARRRETS